VAEPLDFIVIGAPHAGAALVGACLSAHPSIVVATGDAPFHGVAEPGRAALRAHLSRWFEARDPAQVCGLVSEHAMTGGAGGGADTVARRLHRAAPSARVIAVLRDPVDRALAHHDAAMQRGEELRTFATVARELLQPYALQRARRAPTLVPQYVVAGEYGRILTIYAEYFGDDRIHVVVDVDSATASDTIWPLLGLDAPETPEPQHAPAAESQELPEDDPCLDALRAHYARDAAQLSPLLGHPLPWAGGAAGDRTVRGRIVHDGLRVAVQWDLEPAAPPSGL
jgi:hypothetical protein